MTFLDAVCSIKSKVNIADRPGYAALPWTEGHPLVLLGLIKSWELNRAMALRAFPGGQRTEQIEVVGLP